MVSMIAPMRICTVPLSLTLRTWVGALIWVLSIFRLGVDMVEYFISYSVLVSNPFAVFSLVVVLDQFLFPLSDQFPVGLKLDVQNGISAKD